MVYSNGLDKEQNAERLKIYNRTHTKRKNKINICNGRMNWNSCDYIDYCYQEYGKHGCECWKQDGKHDCVRCTEILL
jgi:hypothetical protein